VKASDKHFHSDPNKLNQTDLRVKPRFTELYSSSALEAIGQLEAILIDEHRLACE